MLEWWQGTCEKSRPYPARACTTLVVLVTSPSTMNDNINGLWQNWNILTMQCWQCWKIPHFCRIYKTLALSGHWMQNLIKHSKNSDDLVQKDWSLQLRLGKMTLGHNTKNNNTLNTKYNTSRTQNTTKHQIKMQYNSKHKKQQSTKYKNNKHKT